MLFCIHPWGNMKHDLEQKPISHMAFGDQKKKRGEKRSHWMVKATMSKCRKQATPGVKGSGRHVVQEGKRPVTTSHVRKG